MKQYLHLLQKVLTEGIECEDRTGVGTLSIFAQQLKFDLREGFPLLTTKQMPWKQMIDEALWMFVQGSTNVNDLPKRTQHWWRPWAFGDNELGPIYGQQLRRYGERGVDRLQTVINNIRTNPQSRRHVLSVWNQDDLHKMALPPCHGTVIQFYAPPDNTLSCLMVQRSADCFIGLPVNIASYALLTLMVAQVVGRTPAELTITTGDTHLYKNHVEQAKVQLRREPRGLPTMALDPTIKEIDDFRFEHFRLEDYDPHPRIQAMVAV